MADSVGAKRDRGGRVRSTVEERQVTDHARSRFAVTHRGGLCFDRAETDRGERISG